MKIHSVDFGNKRHVRDFLAVPFRIYADISQWVPPLEMDTRFLMDFKRHPFYRHSQASFYLALQGDVPVGRLAVLDNRRYNEFNHSATAFFYLFECEKRPEIAAGLFSAAFSWARERGLTEILGPKGFTPLDGFGLLVRGFEHRPAFGLPYNPSYYPELVEGQGFEMYSENVSGYLSADLQFPERIHELADRLKVRRGLTISRCGSRKELRSLVEKLKILYNASLGETSGTYPLTDQEVEGMTRQMLWLADPRLIKIVMKREQPVGFLLAYPDVSAAIQKVKGKLWPLGWLRLLMELRRTDWLNINGAGLLPAYRGTGGTAILYSELVKSVRENPRYRHAEVVQIGVENDRMQREMENFGIDFYKMHRVYRKIL